MGFHGLLRGFPWTGSGVPAGFTVCISGTLPRPVPTRGMHMKFLLRVHTRDPSDEKLMPLPCTLPSPGAAGRSQVKNSSPVFISFSDRVRENGDVKWTEALHSVLQCPVWSSGKTAPTQDRLLAPGLPESQLHWLPL